MEKMNIEFVEMNNVKISAEECETKFYDLSEISLGDAVEDYFENVLMA